MELQDIKEVVEMNGKETVNEFLKVGWVLLNTVSQREGDNGWFRYSLGWPGDYPVKKPAGY